MSELDLTGVSPSFLPSFLEDASSSLLSLRPAPSCPSWVKTTTAGCGDGLVVVAGAEVLGELSFKGKRRREGA